MSAPGLLAAYRRQLADNDPADVLVAWCRARHPGITPDDLLAEFARADEAFRTAPGLG